jgi:hypothetical protein
MMRFASSTRSYPPRSASLFYIARAAPPHEGQQLTKKDVTQRLLAQAGIGRMRRGFELGWIWLARGSDGLDHERDITLAIHAS